MKKCFKCGKRKPRTLFYAHPRMGDKLLGKCKSCTKRDVREHRVANRASRAAYERERFKDPKRKAKILEYQRRHRQRFPGKYRARKAVYNAVNRGDLIRLPCIHCGNPKSQAHHDDYRKPLVVKWECFKCHREREHGQVVL